METEKIEVAQVVEKQRMKFKFVGIGAAGNKALLELVNSGAISEQDAVLVNSTNKDIPKDTKLQTIIISPNNSGCGKERNISKEYAIASMKSGKFDGIAKDADSILLITSLEGGTGSGATPIIAKYFANVLGLIVHIVAFTGFEEDVRGIENTVEFFKEIDFECDTQVIRNASFMVAAKNNKYKAETMANEELAKRIYIMLGKELIDSTQNIDDTDIYKVVSTSGYKTIEKIEFETDLVDVDEFNKYCKKMIYDSKSLQPKNPGQARLGVILNIKDQSEDAIDYQFKVIKEAYGVPYECFHHRQYDGKTQYIAFISSGMKMPLDEVEAVYQRYLEATSKVDKADDGFFDQISKLEKDKADSKFDMIRTSKGNSAVTTESKKDFFSNL